MPFTTVARFPPLLLTTPVAWLNFKRLEFVRSLFFVFTLESICKWVLSSASKCPRYMADSKWFHKPCVPSKKSSASFSKAIQPLQTFQVYVLHGRFEIRYRKNRAWYLVPLSAFLAPHAILRVFGATSRPVNVRNQSYCPLT